MKSFLTTLAIMSLAATSVAAEDRTYGSIYLGGLARDVSWPYNDFSDHSVMVCNVNGPDGFLSVRSGPGSNYEQVRAFNRLAILEVDTSHREGNWVRVVHGLRTHTPHGVPQVAKELPVYGWAHDGYLCNFQD
jgi:hypothetical protein